jgi:hypothetical protein
LPLDSATSPSPDSVASSLSSSSEHRMVRSARGRGRPPLQDFLQVKVGAKVLDVGEDARPGKS